MLAQSPSAIRILFTLLVVCSLALALAGSATASRQSATPTPSPLAAMGYPELRITVTMDGVDAPAEISAGRSLMVVEAAGQSNVDVHLVRLPEGVMESDAEAALAESRDEDVPSIVNEWNFAGGLFVPQGQTDRLVLDLSPGTWFIVGADAASAPETEELLRPLQVTESTAAEAPEPAADATVELSDFAFSGLPDGSAPGTQIWQVSNTGSLAHHIILAYYPGEMTRKQLATLVALGETGTPPPGLGVDPNLIEFEVGQVHVLSPGRTIWVELTFDRPGTYLALCFMPDPETGQDHVSQGMMDVFQVS